MVAERHRKENLADPPVQLGPPVRVGPRLAMLDYHGGHRRFIESLTDYCAGLRKVTEEGKYVGDAANPPNAPSIMSAPPAKRGELGRNESRV